MNDNSNRETVEVKRRRQGASSGPQGTERADAPQRRREGGGAGGGGLPPIFSGGGGSGGTGGSIPGRSKMPLWLIILLVIAFVGYTLLTSNQQDTGGNTSLPPTELPQAAQEQAQPTEAPVVQATARPTRTRAAPASGAAGLGQKWTVMVYQDADDQILEQDIYIDLNVIERVGSSKNVNIIAQVDRYKGAFTGDGNWTGTRRYYIQQDDDLSRVNSKLVDDLGEVDMADGSTLVDFVTWTVKNYPADKYALILSDHGMGWPGGFSDPDPAVQDKSRLPIASALDSDNLYLMELDKSLADIQRQAGIDKLELIGMDACLMGHLEVLSALQPYARYAVTSQETEPALGWAYTAFLEKLVQNPGMDGAELGSAIVNSYISDDQRVVDNQARADFLRQGSPMGGLFGSSGVMSADQLASQLEQSVTLTAIDLSTIPTLDQSFNDLAYALQNEDQSIVASARTYAQSFTNIFGKDKSSPYIDLGSFVQMLKRKGISQKAAQAADQVLADEKQAVLAWKNGRDKPGATGVSIYFPNSTLYRSPIAGPQSYTGVAQRFAEGSLWDDFLAFHYNDVGFKPDTRQAAIPAQSAPSRIPGQGEITVSPITLSAKTAAPNKPVTLTTNIRGSNIGYIYLFVGYMDKANNSIYIADSDYLESSDTREVDGVYYPVWPVNKEFTMKLEWEPTVFQISDGQKNVTTVLTPQNYGASAQDAVYTVDGIYHFADGQNRAARLYFRDGMLRQVFGFNNDNFTGGVREITPQSGDTFTLLEKWLDLDASGKVTGSATQEGETLTFGDQMFSWKEVYAAPGSYVVGFIVEDLDGKTQEVYTQVTVR